MSCHQRADDIQLTAKLGGSMEVLRRCLEKVMGWMRASKLELNLGRTEVLLESAESVCPRWDCSTPEGTGS